MDKSTKVKTRSHTPPPVCVFLARIYKGLKKYLINYYLHIMYGVGGVTMLILRIEILRIVFGKIATKESQPFEDVLEMVEVGSDADNSASSVEVFFVDTELVTNKLYGSRWEELSCGCDAEGGDLLSVCEHPSAE